MTSSTLNNLTVYDFNGRKEYIDQDVLASAPTRESASDVTFFKVGKYISDTELEKKYEALGLEPATIKEVLKYDKEHQKEMDEKERLGTHWKDAKGNWCCAAFRRWGDRRGVDVGRDGRDWDDRWWFAGVRKSDLGTENLGNSGTLTLSPSEIKEWIEGLESSIKSNNWTIEEAHRQIEKAEKKLSVVRRLLN